MSAEEEIEGGLAEIEASSAARLKRLRTIAYVLALTCASVLLAFAIAIGLAVWLRPEPLL